MAKYKIVGFRTGMFRSREVVYLSQVWGAGDSWEDRTCSLPAEMTGSVEGELVVGAAVTLDVQSVCCRNYGSSAYYWKGGPLEGLTSLPTDSPLEEHQARLVQVISEMVAQPGWRVIRLAQSEFPCDKILDLELPGCFHLKLLVRRAPPDT